MATITFRAKPEQIYNPDETPAYRRIKVPKITRSYCDMAAFRQHPRFRAYANSDQFLGMLARALYGQGIREYIRLDKPNPIVSVDESGFLAEIRIEVP